jgi:hypothetical protein
VPSEKIIPRDASLGCRSIEFPVFVVRLSNSLLYYFQLLIPENYMEPYFILLICSLGEGLNGKKNGEIHQNFDSSTYVTVPGAFSNHFLGDLRLLASLHNW